MEKTSNGTDAGRDSDTTALGGGTTSSSSGDGSNPVMGDSRNGAVNGGSSGGGLRTHLTRDNIPILAREITALLRPDTQPLLVPGTYFIPYSW